MKPGSFEAVLTIARRRVARGDGLTPCDVAALMVAEDQWTVDRCGDDEEFQATIDGREVRRILTRVEMVEVLDRLSEFARAR